MIETIAFVVLLWMVGQVYAYGILTDPYVAAYLRDDEEEWHE